ncbi:hypothetical protein BAZOLSSOX_307 [uncultured Gammaproteobacteria bacterium]|nr:hypothetical protein BAZOLSSOX_307 [uncultured Gammaproteobacteria bacterium]
MTICTDLEFHSPPHRWLRKRWPCGEVDEVDSPPHRWLRNLRKTRLDDFLRFTTTQVA